MLQTVWGNIHRLISKTLSWALEYYVVYWGSGQSSRGVIGFFFSDCSFWYKAQGHDVHSYLLKGDITDDERRQPSASWIITNLCALAILAMCVSFWCHTSDTTWQLKQLGSPCILCLYNAPTCQNVNVIDEMTQFHAFDALSCQFNRR